MAEENKSSKGIGELFIDFSSKGLPNLLKNLNSVSAQFLLGKNAANQFIQTITALPKEAGNSAVNVGKMSSALGTTYKEYMKLQMYLKSKNLSEGLLNDIANLNNVLFDFKGGWGDLPGTISAALGELNLGDRLTRYTTGFNGILNMVDDIKRRMDEWGYSKDQRNHIFRQLGWSPEWTYALDRGDFNLRNAQTTISDEEVEKNIKMQEALAKSGETLLQIQNWLVSELAPLIENIADKVTEVGQFILRNRDKIKEGAEEAGKNYIKNVGKTLVASPQGRAITGIGLAGAAIYQASKNQKTKDGQLTGGAAAIQELKNLGNDLMPQQINKPPSYDYIRNETKKNGVMDERPWEPDPIQASMPSNMSNLIQNIYINNDIDIQSNNAQETANRIAEIDRQDIEYSQFQMSNLAGR